MPQNLFYILLLLQLLGDPLMFSAGVACAINESSDMDVGLLERLEEDGEELEHVVPLTYIEMSKTENYGSTDLHSSSRCRSLHKGDQVQPRHRGQAHTDRAAHQPYSAWLDFKKSEVRNL